MDTSATTQLTGKLAEIRDQVLLALNELLGHGARMRPLWIGGKQVGFIRGLRISERIWIARMYPDREDHSAAMVRVASTLTPEQIEALSTHEFRRLLRVLHHLTKADDALLPWIYPFSTTTTSERFWLAKQPPINTIHTPSGPLPTYGPSELYNQWAYMAASREEAKVSIRGAQHAGMIVRAWVGKNAQQLMSDLKNSQDRLLPNISTPWQEMAPEEVTGDLDDGWGHAHEDQSLDGLMREYHGMVNEDKHEQLMAELAELQRQQILAENEHLRQLKGRVEGIRYVERHVSDEEVRQQAAKKEQLRLIEQNKTSHNRAAMLDAMETGARSWNIDI
jgi:hypothetical protein